MGAGEGVVDGDQRAIGIELNGHAWDGDKWVPIALRPASWGVTFRRWADWERLRSTCGSSAGRRPADSATPTMASRGTRRSIAVVCLPTLHPV